jgi:TolB-like protein/tetratricopeptide (TPR) repeat protein
MPSVLPGYEYDIFISYRHNDNRSGWVTEFVAALQEELAATIKDPLTIYFDKNPHDGLLETHSVDKSLEGKLKSLIFIPIISQTYCDPKSFAWQHEFCAFNSLAKQDFFGRDIKLGNGNVASRILPIRIHDLDAEDKSMIEGELGGVLRAVDFIYKEAGVNRPLRAHEENPTRNQNQIVYRNQVNKVANAVKEIIASLKNPVNPKTLAANSQEPTAKSNALFRKTIAFFTVAIMTVLAMIYAASQFTSSSDKEPEILDKSIAVLPFADLSSDGDQEYLGDGISEEIINVLAQSPDLKVIARSSSFQFKGKNEDLRGIGKMLGVTTILEGSVRKYKDQVRVTAQLIKVSDGSHYWSKNFDQNTDNIFVIQDGIANEVATALKATLLADQTSEPRTPRNAEAYRLYQVGRSFYDRADPKDRDIATTYFEQSVRADSSFASAWSYLSICYSTIDQQKALRFNEKALVLDAHEPDALANQLFFSSSALRFNEAHQFLMKSLPLKLEVPRLLRQQGQCYARLGHYDEAINFCRRALELDPLQAYSYTILGEALMANGNFGEAETAFRRSFEINRNPFLLLKLLLTQGNLKEFDQLMELLDNEQEKDFLYAMRYHLDGQKEKSLEFVEKLKAIGQLLNIAEVYAFMGNKDEAFHWLQKATQERDPDLVALKSSPYFISLRGDERFHALVKELDYPE